jgi:hypothetical protein
MDNDLVGFNLLGDYISAQKPNNGLLSFTTSELNSILQQMPMGENFILGTCLVSAWL